MKKYTLFLFALCLVLMTYAQKTITKGASVKILEVGEKDSYFDENENFVGKDATAVGDLVNNGDGFYSGSLKLSSGRTCYFTSVKIKALSGSSTSSTTTQSSSSKPSPYINYKSSDALAALTSKTIAKGEKFKVIEVPSADAYYSSRSEIEGQTGVADATLTPDESGYVGGSIKLDNGKSYYFYKVKLQSVSTSNSTTSTANSASNSTTKGSSGIKFITGTISKGTSVYVADLSPNDSYYSNRSNYIGKKGAPNKDDLTMKSDGFYSGNFLFDDGSTAYFYKAKFSKDPVPKVSNPTESNKSSNSTSSDDDDLDWLGTDGDKGEKDYTEWNKAAWDATIKSGDKVKVTAVSPEDSYYDSKEKYIGQEGVASSDVKFKGEDNGYSGTVKLNNGSSPFFYLVKLKKITSFSKSTSANSSTSKNTSEASSGTMKKGTKVMVMEVGPNDSYYSSKSNYLRKKGTVVDGLTNQGDGYYSGKILFDDGTDAYFFNVRLKVLE